ncbi:MAG: hypothetical protein AAFQ94_12645 [Bacteroidota bacterium]
MSNKGILYLIIVVLLVVGMITIPKFYKSLDPLKTDFYLDNSKVYLLREYDYDRSHAQLAKAIESMRELEKELDEQGKFIIETSIKDLDKISEEIENKELSKADLNAAYAKALDALTYAEIKISEHLLEENSSKDAIIALKYGMVHLRNALKYSDSEELKNFEMHIYEELDSLIANKSLSHDEMKKKLDHLLEELDYIVEEKDSIK